MLNNILWNADNYQICRKLLFDNIINVQKIERKSERNVENLYHPIIEQYRAQKIGRKAERNVESLYQAIFGSYWGKKIGRKSERNVERSLKDS